MHGSHRFWNRQRPIPATIEPGFRFDDTQYFGGTLQGSFRKIAFGSGKDFGGVPWAVFE